MLGLMREGFWRDALALFVLAALLGGGAVSAGGGALARYFEGAVTDLLGAPGSYQILVHLRADTGEAGIEALRERLAKIAPGARVHAGPTVAGRNNLFVGVPPDSMNAAFFESLPSELGDVPGYDGHTFVIDPSLVVRDVHPGARARLAQQIERYEHVRFTFQHGGSLWVVLTAPERADAVRSRVEAILADWAVIDVRFEDELTPAAREVAAAGLAQRIAQRLPGLDVEVLEREGGRTELVRDLIEVRTLLEEMAASETELAARLSELTAALEQAAAQREEGGSPALALDAFYAALDQMRLLEERIAELSAQLRSAAGEGDAGHLLIAMLAQNLLNLLTGERSEAPPAPAAGGAVDPDELRRGLDRLAEQLRLLNEIDLAEAAASIRQLEAVIRGIDRDALARASAAVERLIEAEAGRHGRIELLASGNVDEPQVRAAIAEAAAPGQAMILPAGRVEFDARTALMHLVRRAQGLLALALGLLVTVFFFVFDAATVLSFVAACHRLAGSWGLGARAALAASGGAWWGALWCASVALGGVHDPALLAAAGVGGALCGALFSQVAPRLSPVDVNQVEAALSVGLAQPDIVREVVIPGARPGLLMWLNHRARKVRRYGGEYAVVR